MGTERGEVSTRKGQEINGFWRGTIIGFKKVRWEVNALGHKRKGGTNHWIGPPIPIEKTFSGRQENKIKSMKKKAIICFFPICLDCASQDSRQRAILAQNIFHQDIKVMDKNDKGKT